MHLIDWIIVGFYVLGMLLVVAQVGKPKKPTTPGTAAAVVAIDLILIVALLWSHGVIA